MLSQKLNKPRVRRIAKRSPKSTTSSKNAHNRKVVNSTCRSSEWCEFLDRFNKATTLFEHSEKLEVLKSAILISFPWPDFEGRSRVCDRSSLGQVRIGRNNIRSTTGGGISMENAQGFGEDYRAVYALETKSKHSQAVGT